MKLLSIPNDRWAVAAAVFLGCLSVLAEEASLEPVKLPASVRRLPAVDESFAGAAEAPPAADGIEEVVVEGRSMPFLREQLQLAEDKLYSVYNDVNTIDEFDIHCRLHAPTGTRIPQRQCLPNFVAPLDRRRGQAVLRTLRDESAYDLDWISPDGVRQYKTRQLQEHMQQLALEHPDLLEAMRELYGLMQAVDPRRYGGEER